MFQIAGCPMIAGGLSKKMAASGVCWVITRKDTHQSTNLKTETCMAPHPNNFPRPWINEDIKVHLNAFLVMRKVVTPSKINMAFPKLMGFHAQFPMLGAHVSFCGDVWYTPWSLNMTKASRSCYAPDTPHLNPSPACTPWLDLQHSSGWQRLATIFHTFWKGNANKNGKHDLDYSSEVLR